MSDPRTSRHHGSFKDPSGFIFVSDTVVLRAVCFSYKANYDFLIGCGLYKKLINEGLLIPHAEFAGDIPDIAKQCYKILQPEKVTFISYPYEWTFAQLKDAALAMLRIQTIALECGMSLKDAYARNVQFHQGRPVLIDTLSFERYTEGDPWPAYEQFCENFFIPLVLMSFVDAALQRLFQVYPDGIPLKLAMPLLPFRAWFCHGTLLHMVLPHWLQGRFGQSAFARRKRGLSRVQFLRILDSLTSSIKGLRAKYPARHSWVSYYEGDSYSEAALQSKKDIVSEYLKQSRPNMLWDLGSNTGLFSQLAAQYASRVIAFDADPQVVEKFFLEQKQRSSENILPLVMDFADPSPAHGWHHREYLSLVERAPADVTMALALIHHICIRHNVPLEYLAQFLSEISRLLLIEFVPKEDPKVRLMLQGREDVFSQYTRQDFERAFSKYFSLESIHPIKDSLRSVYAMRSKRYAVA